jgi:DNA-binding NarL/FixJ family response regulator
MGKRDTQRKRRYVLKGHLTNRDVMILWMLGREMKVKDIAEVLGLSMSAASRAAARARGLAKESDE